MQSVDDTRGTPAANVLYEGRIVGTAASETDTIMVRLDRFGELPFGDPDGAVWMPRPDDTFPTDGDWCVAAETDQGTWIVLTWTPA